jgi:Protein of unknown function DUF262
VSDLDDARATWLDRIVDSAVEAEHSPYRVADYIGWQRDGSLELRPHYQRGSVWTKKDKSFLIDSLIKGYPLPLIVLQDELHSEHPRVRRRVVDGQQRLRTLFAFVEPEILEDRDDGDTFLYTPPELARERISLTFETLPSELQNRLLNTRIPAVLLDSSTGEREVLEVYDRLNSTGLGLSAQELRYARREGSFADLSYRLARLNQIRWTEWSLFRDQDIARMREVEFTSELVLLLINGVAKTGRAEIDDAYKNQDFRESIPDQEGVESYFVGLMSLLDAHLAKPQRPDRVRMFRTKGWFYALCAYSMQNLGYLDADYRRTTSSLAGADFKSLTGAMETLFREAPAALDQAKSNDPDLVRSVSGSASDRASRTRRLGFLESVV